MFLTHGVPLVMFSPSTASALFPYDPVPVDVHGPALMANSSCMAAQCTRTLTMPCTPSSTFLPPVVLPVPSAPPTPVSNCMAAQRAHHLHKHLPPTHNPLASSFVPLGCRAFIDPGDPVSFGRMDGSCSFCGAKQWLDERTRGTLRSPVFSWCCRHGCVGLDLLPDPPDELCSLFTGDDDSACDFCLQIHQYNCAFAFASFTTNKENLNTNGGGPWIWKTGYMVYHSISSLLPPDGEPLQYAQLYFHDPVDALNFRMNRNTNLRPDIMVTLQELLIHFNRYVQPYFHAYEVLHDNPAQELAICLISDPSTDQRRYNQPSVDEVAIIIPGDDSRVVDPREVVLRLRTGGLRHISDLHSAYAPLHYVLLFPHGTPGWTHSLHLCPHEQDNGVGKRLTQVHFYSFCLFTRDNEFPILHHGGCLFQQYLCDIWVSTNQNHLRWMESNQHKLRASLYSGLEDAVGNMDHNLNLHNIGTRVILPSSYIGGPCYMNQCFQDAMSLAQYYHGFDLFITFTSNPTWPEIQNELLAAQSPSDRPDLVVCVFRMYQKSLIDDLMKQRYLATRRLMSFLSSFKNTVCHTCTFSYPFSLNSALRPAKKLIISYAPHGLIPIATPPSSKSSSVAWFMVHVVLTNHTLLACEMGYVLKVSPKLFKQKLL